MSNVNLEEEVSKISNDGVAPINQELNDEVTPLKRKSDDEVAPLKRKSDDDVASLKRKSDDEVASLKRKSDDEVAPIKRKLNEVATTKQVSHDGIAHIKQEYIVSVKKLKEKKNWVPNKLGNVNARNAFTNKRKRRGKNHNRPKLVLETAQKKLCRNYWCLLPEENPGPEKCSRNECIFSHDVEGFLKNKPQDIGDKCHNFLTYGFCQYGVVCRYGGSHIQSNGSVVDQERRKIYEATPPVRNILKKEVQKSLRKRSYDFSAAKAIFDAQGKVTRDSVNEMPQVQINENTAISDETTSPRIGPASDEDLIPLRPSEKKKIDWNNKLYLAPLTTLGNLPYRRVCKRLGADVTCSEMALATGLLQGSSSEWALVKRHSSEDCFGVQLCGSNAEAMVKSSYMLNNEIDMDFVDINMGCPIDLIYKQGGGSALMRRFKVLEEMVLGMNRVVSCPVTLKMRTGVYRDYSVAHYVIEKAKLWDIKLITLHGRSREQRFVKLADWGYIKKCAKVADPVPLFGNGDVLTFEEYNQNKRESNVAGVMVARGALIKPWIFTEIKEQRHWDISSNERLDILREFVHNGMEHWGSDSEGVEKTRRFLLEWLSFLYRYIPVGLLELPQKLNQRPPTYMGRNDLETLMASNNSKDWIKISEMLLGPVPENFVFLPKHNANSWS